MMTNLCSNYSELKFQKKNGQTATIRYRNMADDTRIVVFTNCEVLIDSEDFYRVVAMGFNKHIKRGKVYFEHTGYNSRKKGRIISLHRFILNAHENMVVDHINGNTFDNRKCNLRVCSTGENTRNQKKEETIHRDTKGFLILSKQANGTQGL
jgi:hypothetical protein